MFFDSSTSRRLKLSYVFGHSCVRNHTNPAISCRYEVGTVHVGRPLVALESHVYRETALPRVYRSFNLEIVKLDEPVEH